MTLAADSGWPHRAGGAGRRAAVARHGRVAGVSLAGGGEVRARETIVANGLGAAGLGGLPAGTGLPLRPVHGDILRLRVPAQLRPLLGSTVRGLVRGVPVYIVPRQDGTVVIGATQREDALAEPDAAGAVSAGACTSCSGTPSSCCRPSPSWNCWRRPPGPGPGHRTTRRCWAASRTGAGPRRGRRGTDHRHRFLPARHPPDAGGRADLPAVAGGTEDPRWAPFRPDRFTAANHRSAPHHPRTLPDHSKETA